MKSTSDFLEDRDAPVETLLFYHRETEKAVRVSIRGNDAGGFWLPKSQIDITKISGGKIRFTWPAWMARSKGLI